MSEERVDHPKHYNNHRSGVEAIEICEWLPFNLGNAVKYIMRCEDKGTFLEDVKKAKWYMMREITRYNDISNYDEYFNFEHDNYRGYLISIIKHESDDDKRDFFCSLMKCMLCKDYDSIEGNLHDMYDSIESMSASGDE